MRIIHPSLFLCALVACASSEAKGPSEVTIDLSSVTLGDTCPTPTPPPPPANKFAKPPPTTPNTEMSRGSCSRPPCPSPRRRATCEQTSMQLSFAAQPGAKATTITIKRVELLDDKGRLIETLAANMPTQWDASKGAYLPWDGALAAGMTAKTSFRLASPNWGKLGGRFAAQARSYQLRVVVTVGGADRTVEKQAIIPAHIEPMIVT